MSYQEDDYLMISALQHYAFCRRQWALIHLEQQWEDNLRTTEGNILHERAHNEQLYEKKEGVIITRSLRVFSASLGITGSCDVVEFHPAADGVSLVGEAGSWLPYPVEYKRGTVKTIDADRLQLCAQAMCLEEMLCCRIPEGALYYGEIHRREKVPLRDELRKTVRTMLMEMHEYTKRGCTPKAKRGKYCNACSMKEVCLPVLSNNLSVSEYIKSCLEEGSP